MPVELSPSVVRPRLPGISWPAIFAALAVGIAVQLLLTLAGFALGINTVTAADEGSETITLAAASWSAVSMLVAAPAITREAVRDAADVGGTATLWLAATLLLSLLLAIAGGIMGVRGVRRTVRRNDEEAVGPQPRILSRT